MPAPVLHDLSVVHEPLTDLFERQLGIDANEFRLSDDQLASFETNGFLTGVKILESEQIEQLREELGRLWHKEHPKFDLWHEFHTNESSDPDKVLFHALGAWRMEPGFHDLLFNPALLIPASQLLQGSVRFWHDQLFCKPAQHGGVVAWHQDYSYWTRTKPMSHLTCWIGLDDATPRNGCVQYIPGSHRWDLLPITGLAGDMDAIREVLDGEQWEAMQNPVPAELKKGEATFHHPLMVHGSFANETDGPRRGVVVNLVRDGVRSESEGPLLQGVPSISVGQPLGGQFFPLLHQSETSV